MNKQSDLVGFLKVVYTRNNELAVSSFKQAYSNVTGTYLYTLK